MQVKIHWFWIFVTSYFVVLLIYSTHFIFLLPTETRYLAVTWNLYHYFDPILLKLNQNNYLEKPPLYFFLLASFWHIFGVSNLTTRLFSELIGIVNLILCFKLSQLLWQDIKLSRLVILIMLGQFLWIVFAPLVMLDTLLGTCVLLATIAIFSSGSKSRYILWIVANAFGVLIKGPVIFIFTLCGLLGLFFFKKCCKKDLAYYFLGLFISLLPILVWLILLSRRVSWSEIKYLMFYQTAERINGFGPYNFVLHNQPFWWYLPWIPVLFIPWIFYPQLLKNLRSFKSLDWQTKYLLSISGLVILIFSFFSGKNINYIIPVMPFLALVIAKIFYDIQYLRNEVSLIIISLSSLLLVSTAFLIYTQFCQHSRQAKLTSEKIHSLQAQDRGIALINLYEESFSYYARLKESQVSQIQLSTLKQWCNKNKQGFYVSAKGINYLIKSCRANNN